MDVCDELFRPSLEIEEHKKRLVRLFLLGSRILDGAISYFILFSPVNKLFVGQHFLGFDRNHLVFTVAVLFASLMNIKKCVDEDGQKVLNFTMLTLHLTAFFIVGIDAIVIVVSSFF